ncbi:MAG: hypothetical protein ABJA98_24150 [Acidobacteriota bacterium]
MLSLEPFTMHAGRSRQLFQTGESYQQTPLVNYQHPHDLLMGLGATYRVERRGIAYLFGAALVGSPRTRTDGVHASRIGERQPAGAARTSQHGFHAHYAWRRDVRYRRGSADGRSLSLSRRGTGRAPVERRAPEVEFLVEPHQLAPWSLG